MITIKGGVTIHPKSDNSEFMDKLSEIYSKFYKYNTYDAHALLRYHIESFAGDIMKVAKFVLYRWWDYEIYRFKHGAD